MLTGRNWQWYGRDMVGFFLRTVSFLTSKLPFHLVHPMCTNIVIKKCGDIL